MVNTDFLEKSASGATSPKVVLQRIEILESEQRGLEFHRDELENRINLLSRSEPTLKQINKARIWFIEYSAQLNDEQKREFLHLVVDKIIVWPEKPYPGEGIVHPGIELEFKCKIPIDDFNKVPHLAPLLTRVPYKLYFSYKFSVSMQKTEEIRANQYINDRAGI